MIDGLIRLFFEDMILLVVAEVIALAVALGIHRRRFTARSRRGVWITLAVCAALITLSIMMVTDREALKDLIKTLARAVDEGDVETIGAELDDTFVSDGRDKQRYLTERVNHFLQRWSIDEAKVGRFEIEIQDDSATVTFSAFCNARGSHEMRYNIPSRWRLQFVKRAEGWKVINVQPLKVAGRLI